MSLSMVSPRKRPHPNGEIGGDTQAGIPSAMTLAVDGVAAPGYPQQQQSVELGQSYCSSDTSRLTSPALSTNDSSICDAQALPAQVQQSNPDQPAKRRKLTFAEKESKRVEKELKDKQKAEEKAKKEDEKRTKEEERRRKEEEIREEKRKKEEEKEEKKRAKDMERAAKEEEKRRREEEKAKKEKSQMRLNAFFVKPAASNTGGVGTPPTECRNPMDRRSGSVGSTEGIDTDSRSRSNSASPQKNRQSDYERLFPPFFLQSHTTLAPSNHFSKDLGALVRARQEIDVHLRNEWNGAEKICRKRKALQAYTIEQLHIPPHKLTKRVKEPLTVKEVMERINGAEDNPIDLIDYDRDQRHNPVELLESVSMKYLQFAEDVRPPYRGTYTKLPTRKTATELARNPFERALPKVNYDYDSEAEWEEPGEGEDLDSEGEEENGSEDEEDEMDGFLDDEDVGEGTPGTGNKRRHVVGNLEPVCSGLCWENTGEEGCKQSMEAYRLEIILEQHSFPIDPFSTAYWPDKDAHSAKTTTDAGSLKPATTLMNPPRIPLHAINRTNTVINGSTTSSLTLVDSDGKLLNTTPTHATPSKGQKRQVAPELMPDFKRAIQGSDLTKAGLIEILKKQFPKTSKDAIKDTLTAIADRVGVKEVDKRWIIKDGL